VQQPIGEHVATLGVSDELDLVDRQEVHVQPDRHGFDRADPVARLRRDALFLPGHERDRALAYACAHPIVDLARQQAQRQAHHARLEVQHALDRAVGLARVGGTEQRVDG